LVNLLALGVLALVIGNGERSKLQCKRELVMRLGDDFRLFGIQLDLVVERCAAVLDGIGVSVQDQLASCRLVMDVQEEETASSIPFVLERDFGKTVVGLCEALLDVSDG
jgi:hypothetical protein